MTEAFFYFVVLYAFAFALGFILGRSTAPKTYVQVPEDWTPLGPTEPEWWPEAMDPDITPVNRSLPGRT